MTVPNARPRPNGQTDIVTHQLGSSRDPCKKLSQDPVQTASDRQESVHRQTNADNGHHVEHKPGFPAGSIRFPAGSVRPESLQGGRQVRLQCVHAFLQSCDPIGQFQIARVHRLYLPSRTPWWPVAPHDKVYIVPLTADHKEGAVSYALWAEAVTVTCADHDPASAGSSARVFVPR